MTRLLQKLPFSPHCIAKVHCHPSRGFLLTKVVVLSAMLSVAFGQTNIPLGTNPTSAAVNPATNKIYVANYNSGNVTVIDGATNSTATVAAGSGPVSIAVNPVTNKIYVANRLSANVTVIDGTTNSTSTVAAGNNPTSVAVNPVTNKIYVANYKSANVTVIDGTTNSTSTVAAGTGPLSVAVNPVTNRIYVANASSDNVTVIEGATNSAATIAAGTGPSSLAVNPVTNKIYVANYSSGNVTVIDGATNSTATVAAGTGPTSVSANPVTNRIYVANYSSNNVTVIDGAMNGTAVVAVGASPDSLAVNPVTNKIYVANYGSNNVTVIDGATNSTAIDAAGMGPNWLVVNPVTNKIYVANATSNNATVIDGATNSTATVGVGTTPFSVAANPVTNKIYVANQGSSNVTVIDGATNSTSTVAAGTTPSSVAVNPVTNKIYVANKGSNNVTVIDGATNSTAAVATGSSPSSVAVNPVTNKIYVANEASANVTVIDGATNSTSTVAAESTPESVAVNPVTNKIYVANYGSTNVTVIDGATNSTSTVAAGSNPYRVAVNPVTNKIYVTNLLHGNVTVIDGATNSTATVTAGNGPESVAVNPVTNKVYVANYFNATVTVIDGATNSTATVTAGDRPGSVAVNPVTNKIYVANQNSGNVTVIDGITNATSTVAAGSSPGSVAVNPMTNMIYVANYDSNNVTVITEQQVQPVPLTASITPLAGDQTANSAPTFTFAASSTFSPTATTPDRVFYQADTWQSAWSETAAGSGSYTGTLAALSPGFHILYAYSGDGQEATSTQTSPLIGAIQAYGFLVLPPPPVPLSQTITFNAIAAVTYGIAPFQLTASASSNLPVSYSGGAVNVCSVNATGLVTILGPGQCSVTANQAGNVSYAPAASVTQSFQINPKATPILSVTKTHSGNFIPGQTGVVYTITVANSASGSATSGDPNSGLVTVVDTASSANLTNVTLSGSGWKCIQNGCSRYDVLQPGSAYSPITATANVALTASTFNNVVNVYYGASSTAAASVSDATTILQPQLGVGVTHGLNFKQGQTNAHYTVTITNLGSSAVGGIVVTENLPTGLTLASIPSLNWNCNGNVCSPAGPLLPGSTIPLDVYVNVAANAPASVTNQVTVTATGLAQPIVTNDVTGIDPAAPSLTLAPTSGAGSTQAFTFTFPSPGGYQNLAGAQIVINSTLTAVNSCYVLFARPDVISLAADSGNSFQSTSLGAPAVLQNSQCVVLASLTTQSGSGNIETLTLNVVFKASFAGPKTVWANYNSNAGVSAGYQQLGTYTATAPQSGFASAVTPASGQGQAQAFTFRYFDAYGAPDISGAQVAFNSTLSGANACYILLSAANTISLASDDASKFSTAVFGQQNVLQNSQCTVFPGLSYQTQSGQTLSFTVFVAFKPGFTGSKNIYSSVNNNAGASSGFAVLGTWNVTGNPGLSPTSVYPSSATGPSQALTFVFADPSGASDIGHAQVVINPTLAAANSCLVDFDPAAGTVFLYSDDAQGGASANLGQPTVLENSQCIVNPAASASVSSGNYLTLTLFLTMKKGGMNNIYSAVHSPTLGDSTVLQVGTWNVTSPPALSPVSVSPQTGAGTAGSPQFLTFNLSDPAGASDISGSLIVLYPSLQGANACYILWGHDSNLLSLASDNVQSFSSGTLGSTGLLSNSQCTVDPFQSFAVQTGNTVNLTLAVSFNAAYKKFGQIYSWVNVQNQAHALSGWFVESRFTVQ